MTRETGTQGLVGTFSLYLLTKLSEGYEGVSVIGNGDVLCPREYNTTIRNGGRRISTHTHTNLTVFSYCRGY